MTKKSTAFTAIKAEVTRKATDLIDKVLKPKFVQPPPKGVQMNYIVDIILKWLGQKCFFVAIFKTPDGTTFEEKFARLQYVGHNRFNLAFVRPTGQWVDMPYQNQTLDECLKAILEDPWFQLA
jgi:hypothetical protein